MNKNQRLYYLANPYSHPDEVVREQRFLIACDVAGWLLQQGVFVYSPIAHTHPIACRCELPKGWDFWRSYDLSILTRCDAMIVVMSDGWDTSKGVAEEIRVADASMPIHYMPYPSYKGWCLDGI